MELSDIPEELREEVAEIAGDRHLDSLAVSFMYCNYRGDVSERHAIPISIRFGSTEWHPRPQYLMKAYDIDKKAMREFAVSDWWEWKKYKPV